MSSSGPGSANSKPAPTSGTTGSTPASSSSGSGATDSLGSKPAGSKAASPPKSSSGPAPSSSKAPPPGSNSTTSKGGSDNGLDLVATAPHSNAVKQALNTPTGTPQAPAERTSPQSESNSSSVHAPSGSSPSFIRQQPSSAFWNINSRERYLESRLGPSSCGSTSASNRGRNPFTFLQTESAILWNDHPHAKQFASLIRLYLNRTGYKDGIRIRQLSGSGGGCLAGLSGGQAGLRMSANQSSDYYAPTYGQPSPAQMIPQMPGQFTNNLGSGGRPGSGNSRGLHFPQPGRFNDNFGSAGVAASYGSVGNSYGTMPGSSNSAGQGAPPCMHCAHTGALGPNGCPQPGFLI